MAAPPRPPDRADMNTRKQVTNASMRSSAYDLASRVWNAASHGFFGDTNPRPDANGSYMKTMPLMYFGQGNFDHGRINPLTTAGLAYNGQIRFPLNILHQIAFGAHAIQLPPGRTAADRVAYRSGVKERQNDLIQLLLHEIAHTQQVNHGSHLSVEGGADAFSVLASPYVQRVLGNPHTNVAPVAGYGNLWRAFVAKYGRNAALFGQFGARGH